jgi:hypothetical protein
LFLVTRSMKIRQPLESKKHILGKAHVLPFQSQYSQTAPKTAPNRSARSKRQTTMNAPAPSGDDDHRPPWLSPSQIAAKLGVSSERIGHTINRLGLRGNLGGYVRAVIVRKGHLWFIQG